MGDNSAMRVMSVTEDAMNIVGTQLSDVPKESVNSESVLRAYAMVAISNVTEEFQYDGRIKV